MENFVRYIFGFLGLMAIVVFLIVLIFRLADRDTTPLIESRPALTELATTDTNLVFTESGPIIAQEKHYMVRITVGDDSRRVEVIQGYNNNVVAQANFDNTEEAYEQFLAALDRNGYNEDRNTDIESENGLCANGKRFVFETIPSDALTRRWATSCSERGNIAGKVSIIVKLFQDQIPEYNRFVNDARREAGLNP